MQQVAALGVLIGALLLRLTDQALAAESSPVAPYTVAFSALALLLVHPLLEVLRLRVRLAASSPADEARLGAMAQLGCNFWQRMAFAILAYLM